MQKFVAGVAALSAVAVAVVVTLAACTIAFVHPAPDTGTSYQAVALMNGQMFFGKLEDSNRDYLTLRDVFYIQGRQNPETKAVSSVLVKRGGEAHAPDRMLINRQQVLLVEPVKGDSQIAKLIAEQNAAR
ncbi:hypothetical protein GJ699_33115 [Duganella sp. FT80W]|uniref:Outer membrane protein assembly factor BamE n=1 Tax=Duganella guangzhouensis TaxID=2666084 RepID=A0A6I2LDG9_9BURK|nr:hypothetical protein [Duganella guangzhouensis]MRW94816.1 hypothetical protein [Duganella guangzhouensis]